eukprot:CAMPEP_0114657764 /NCGR_PEP_ID=MMETSP0191-20121206/14518_1 /TAXON_ID=126664 /ORGANISM="Sorites sp." /LENGTH=129 /DNA_ID=CAMNT_0001878001 /DNA_START=180 /DNA_END=566 /DNA_ORIENTATION=+
MSGNPEEYLQVSSVEQRDEAGTNKNDEKNSDNNSNDKPIDTYCKAWKRFVLGDIFDNAPRKYPSDNPMEDVVNGILDEAKEEEDFDIFQMCAFYYGKTTKKDKKYAPYYFVSVLKALLCLVSQLFMLGW